MTVCNQWWHRVISSFSPDHVIFWSIFLGLLHNSYVRMIMGRYILDYLVFAPSWSFTKLVINHSVYVCLMSGISDSIDFSLESRLFRISCLARTAHLLQFVLAWRETRQYKALEGGWLMLTWLTALLSHLYPASRLLNLTLEIIMLHWDLPYFHWSSEPLETPKSGLSHLRRTCWK